MAVFATSGFAARIISFYSGFMREPTHQAKGKDSDMKTEPGIYSAVNSLFDLVSINKAPFYEWFYTSIGLRGT